jgi:hypothetical protein
MAMPTPEQGSTKWEQSLGNAFPRVKAGVQAVTAAPTALAAAQAQKWLQRLGASQATWTRRLQQVSLQEWKDSYTQQLEGIWPELIAKSTYKYRAAAGKLYPVIASLRQALPARTTSIETNIARVRQMAIGLNQAKTAGQLDWR